MTAVDLARVRAYRYTAPDGTEQVLEPGDVELVVDEHADGPVLAAVKADIGRLGPLEGGARRSLAALALWGAEQIDQRGADSPLAIVSRAMQELRATLVELFKEQHDRADDLRKISDSLSTPLGYGEDTGPADAGSEGGADSRPAGETAAAAPADDC